MASPITPPADTTESQVFPAEILGMIFNVSTFPTQIAFRDINKAWCQFVGKRFFKHAVAWTADRLNSGITFRGYGRKSPLAVGGAWPHGYSPFLLDNIEVLDIGCDYPKLAEQVNLLIRRCPNLRTIRRIGWQAVCIDTTLSLDQRLERQPYNVVDYYYREPCKDSIVVRFATDQPRHTIHFNYDNDAHRHGLRFDFITGMNQKCTLREIVIVLWRNAPVGPEDDDEQDTHPDEEDEETHPTQGHHWCYAYTHEYELFIAGNFTHALESFLLGGGRLTFVGLERFRKGSELVNMEGLLRRLRPPHGEFHDLSALVRQIDCVTLEAWWTELGPRKEEEGLWNPPERPDIDYCCACGFVTDGDDEDGSSASSTSSSHSSHEDDDSTHSDGSDDDDSDYVYESPDEDETDTDSSGDAGSDHTDQLDGSHYADESSTDESTAVGSAEDEGNTTGDTEWI
ncbi:uncharacterized protein LOC62_04G005309 [Vanrija pseudolonga]|uniref:Uncharacterized protein n=1 Tax=Vanrija pseudolonga TaxID=143232 RepID=A0AAF0YE11_9TREE|nr:hypothetical protein LOC62_04G005309 [Vanrija pseudolonga]